MPESGPYGSVRGALSNERPYRDKFLLCSGPEQSACGRPERAPPHPARNQLPLDVDKQDEGRISEGASY
jgi:hypothetical protein